MRNLHQVVGLQNKQRIPSWEEKRVRGAWAAGAAWCGRAARARAEQARGRRLLFQSSSFLSTYRYTVLNHKQLWF